MDNDVNGPLGTMDPETRIVRNAGIIGATSVFSKIFLLFFVSYVANKFGAEVWGRYGFLMNSVTVLLVLADLGVEGYMERELARRRDMLKSRTYYLMLFRTLGVVLLSIFLVLFIAHNNTGRLHRPLIFLAPILTLAVGLFNVLRSCIRSTERMIFEAGLFNAERLSFMAFGLLAVVLGGSLEWFVGVQTIVSIFAAVAAYFVFRYVVRGLTAARPEGFGVFSRDSIIASLPFWMTALCSTILYREDVLMLSWLSGDLETGRYYTAFRMTEGLLLIPQSIALAVYPTFSRMAHTKQDVNPIFQILLRFLLVSGLGLVLIGTAFSGRIFSLFRPEFAPSAGILTILLYSVPFIYANYLTGTTMRAADRQVRNFQATVAAMVMNFIANLILIPWFGARGAAVATVVTQVSYLALMLCFSQGFLSVRKIGFSILIMIGIGIAAQAGADLIGVDNIILVCLVRSVILVGLCFAFRIISVKEIHFIIKALRGGDNTSGR